LEKATEKTKKEYRDSVCDRIMKFQKTGLNILMYMKMEELGWKENHGVEAIGIEDTKKNIIDERDRY